MQTAKQIAQYISSLPAPKRLDMLHLHNRVLELKPGCRTWFLDGRNEEGKIISNPNIGYGTLIMSYADGSSREFYRVGLSANTGGISVYIMGLKDKSYLSDTYGAWLEKAGITGYCIKFRALKDISEDVLMAAIADGLGLGS